MYGSTDLMFSYRFCRIIKQNEKFIHVSEDSLSKAPIKKAVHQIILSANDWVSIKKNPGFETLYDFRADREYILSHDTLLTSNLLFHVVDNQVAEFTNRLFLAKTLAIAGQGDAMGDLFFQESVFGVEKTKDSLKSQIKSRMHLDTVIYTVNGKTVARIVYSKKDLSAACKVQFEKYLLYEVPLHPCIRAELMKKGLLPAFMEVYFFDMSQSGTYTYELEKAIQDVPSQAVKEMKRMPRYPESRESLRGLLDSMVMAVNYGQVHIQDKASCITVTDKLSEKGKYLDAILNLLEYNLTTGDAMGEELKKVARHQSEDSLMSKFFLCLDTPKSKQDAIDKIEGFEQIKSHKLEKGYLLGIFMADFYGDLGKRAEMKEAFFSVLKINPLISGAYVDLGKMYREQYNMNAAWECFDIALKLAPENSMMEELNSLKANLKTDYPQYFLIETAKGK